MQVPQKSPGPSKQVNCLVMANGTEPASVNWRRVFVSFSKLTIKNFKNSIDNPK
jgi:hypothetical protein